MILECFDTTTELIPSHNQVDQFCLVFAGFCGLVAGGTCIYLSRGLSVVQRIVLPLVFMFEASLCVFLVAGHVSSIVEGRMDFPAGKTHTRQVLFRISRAYATHGKGSGYYIQTMPIWSNLDITSEDYDLMREHRRPGDEGRNPDEVSSRGYFCAKVMIEEANGALRILHAGSQKLPRGTVMVCPGFK